MRTGWFIGFAVAAVVLDSAVAPEIELLGALRADLGLVAIDCLTPAKDEIIPANGADRLAQDVAGRQRVTGRRAAVG